MGEDNGALPQRHMLTRDKAAAIVYYDLKESERAAFSVAAEYGRWLIISLIAVNGGALWGLFSYLGSIGAKGADLAPYVAPVWSFAIGIALGMISGLAAWINWSKHSDSYRQMARYDMLWDPQKWVDDPQHDRVINRTYWVSIAAGIGSMVAALVGCAFILHGNFIARAIHLLFG